MKCFYLRFVLFSLLYVLFFSCSNSQNTKLINIDSDTLKKKINKIDEDVIWTKDIEPEILSDMIKPQDGLHPSILPNVQVLNVLNDTKNKVYPFFDDFGSLNDENVSSSLRTFLDDFFASIKEGFSENCVKLFSNEHLFSYVLFKNDIQNKWIEFFDKEEILFTSYLIGEPFYFEDTIELPLRLYFQKGFVYLTIHILEKSGYKIYQIDINRWEIDNEQ